MTFREYVMNFNYNPEIDILTVEEEEYSDFGSSAESVIYDRTV